MQCPGGGSYLYLGSEMDCKLVVLVPVLLQLLVVNNGGSEEGEVVWDPSGYILYCPCMGEWGFKDWIERIWN